MKMSSLPELVWPVPLAQVWAHYKIGKLNMWTLFCNGCIDFLNNQIWNEIMLELNGKPSSVTTFSTDFSFQNLVFWNLFEFSVAEIT
jgi:rRNA maturation endonuclease Nob1